MATLRKFAPQEISALVVSIREQLADRVLTQPVLNTILERLKFRDPRGDTWSIGPVSQAWYVYRNGSWAHAAAPEESLDGPVELAGLSVHASKPAARTERAVDADEPAPGDDPAAYLLGAVERVAAAYADGAIHSDAAEGLLDQLYLVDGGGTLWSLGVRSRAWYTFTGSGWQRAEAGPQRSAFRSDSAGNKPKYCESCGQALTKNAKFCANCGAPVPVPGDEASAAKVAASLGRFLTAAAEHFPESVVPPWEPPADFPEPVVKCQHCGAFNIGPLRECISCQRALQSDGPAAKDAAPAPPAYRPAQSQPAALPGAAAPPAAGPARQNRRVWWFLGGSCCLGLVFLCACLLIFWVLNDNYFYWI